MALTIEQVLAKASEEISYIFDAPIHYVVLTRQDNTWDMPRINRYLEVLDQIEATEGPGVMVTIGTGDRFFSTGFDLPNWAKDIKIMHDCIVRFDEVMARLLEFSMPSLCVFNGTAMAGGYILGMLHDFRTMRANSGTICLSELKLGFDLTLPYMLACQAKLSPSVCLKALYAVNIGQEEALKDGLIDSLYLSREDLQAQVSAFVKRFAQIGAHRAAIKTNKTN